MIHFHGGGAALHDVNVDLPASTANPAPRPDKPLFVTLKPDLTLAVGESPVARGDLASSLDAETQGNNEQRVFVRANRAVPYGEVMELMNLLRGAGYLKITTVPEKAIPFRSTRGRCIARERLVRLAAKHGVTLRRSYARVGKLALLKQQRYAHARQFKRAKR